MAKFKPSDHVDRLEYDFTEYGGREGTIPEPNTKRVNQYFAEVRAIASDVKEIKAIAGVDPTAEGLTDEEIEEIMAKVDEASAKAQDFQVRTMQALAALCGAEWEDEDGHKVLVGGSPSFEDLDSLPFRVFQAFNQWLMGEIRPKKTTPAIKR